MINDEALKRIETLHRMKQDGVITEEDFEKSKASILHGQPQRRAATVSGMTVPAPQSNDALQWMLMPLRRYADFEGRSSRKEFWMFLLFTNLVAAALFVFGAIVSPDLGIGLLALGFLGVLVPFISVQVRRFHDQGKSGWFALFNLIPYVGIIVILIFMLIEGTVGDNEYGSDPKMENGNAE